MKWSWKIVRVAGIDIYMHATFLILIGWVALSHWIDQRSWSAVLSGVLFIMLLFAFVVIHEYGHALTARKFGIKTRDITLYPIGGVARLERMPEKPIQEFWVALAGPAVNAVIAVALFAWLWFSNNLVPLNQVTISSGPFIERLMTVNITLVLFNLIPAFPMDGGRVLRALLALRLEYTRATQIAANVGQGLAFVLGFAGLFINPFLLFIAFFVWVGASQEASMVQMKQSLSNIPVARAMITEYHTLTSNDTLEHAVQLLLESAQTDFPVIDDGQVSGMLRREDLMATLARRGQNIPVAEVIRRDLPVIDSHEMLETALIRLQESNHHTLPVTHNGQLVGLITSENIAEFLMVRSALNTAKRTT